MTDTSLDELGPVDYLVVEFPAGASNFTGEMAAELLALVDSGTIRVIDILILTKDEDGAVEAVELADVGELGELQAVEAQLAELLAEDDVEHLAAAMEPNSTAGVLIWENLWAAVNDHEKSPLPIMEVPHLWAEGIERLIGRIDRVCGRSRESGLRAGSVGGDVAASGEGVGDRGELRERVVDECAVDIDLLEAQTGAGAVGEEAIERAVAVFQLDGQAELVA